MAKPNPRKALAAFLPASIPIPGTDVAVRPLTLAAYAILEKIGSPLVVPSEGVTALDVIPTLYVLTHDPVEVMSEDLAAASVAWADGLAPSALIPIEEAARRQVRAWLDVLPEVEKKEDDPEPQGDGWLAELAGWACETYGWTWREVAFETPASALALLLRQWRLRRGDKFFLLSEMEAADARRAARMHNAECTMQNAQ